MIERIDLTTFRCVRCNQRYRVQHTSSGVEVTPLERGDGRPLPPRCNWNPVNGLICGCVPLGTDLFGQPVYGGRY